MTPEYALEEVPPVTPKYRSAVVYQQLLPVTPEYTSGLQLPVTPEYGSAEARTGRWTGGLPPGS